MIFLKIKRCSILIKCLCILIFLSYVQSRLINNSEELVKPSDEFPSVTNKTIKDEPNCTERSDDSEFPQDLFTLSERRNGAILLHILCVFYCFLLTAYVCNDYLLPAIDCICTDLKISTDVAAATFLATASCFPELFVNLVCINFGEEDLGSSAVVGGAVFNTFATSACGALFAAKGIKLKWPILTRECLIYTLSVVTLVIFTWDSKIEKYEAVILLLLFVTHFTFLFLNKSITKFFKKLCSNFDDTQNENKGSVSHENYTMPFGTYRPYFHGELIVEYRNSIRKVKTKDKNNDNKKEIQCNTTSIMESYTEPETIFVWPSEETVLKKLWFIFTWPLKFMLYITVPDCRFRNLRHWYPATFLIGVLWIGLGSYMVSWMADTISSTINLPSFITGLTLVAAGGNMPEMVSIVILSRQGQGDMAMSNILGSNTLDILLCLGLPWTIKTVVLGQELVFRSQTMAYGILTIILCVIGFYTVTAYYKFTLNKKVGALCLIMYSLFLTFNILMELGYIKFGDFTC